MTIPSKILVRTDTAANWATANPILSAGEPAWVNDSKLFAVGDGVATFAALPKFKNAAQVDASAADAAASAAAAAADAVAVAAALGSLSPTLLAAPGALVMFPATTAPVGYLKANGATGLLRADFPALWAFIQGSGLLAASEGAKQPHQFGPGNGTTTFSLLDARGYALRAWDDGRGVDAGRGIGTYQQDQFQDHGHNGTTADGGLHSHGATQPAHNHGVNDPGHSHSAYDTGHVHDFPVSSNETGAGQATVGNTGVGNYSTLIGTANIVVVGAATNIAIQLTAPAITVNNGGTHNHTFNVAAANSGNRGTETRGKNVAYLLCIKF